MPPDRPTYFLDRCLGKRVVANVLRATGLSIEVHVDHFPVTERDAETDDTTWLADVGKRNWIILTRDTNIARNQMELEALYNSGVPSFVLTSRKPMTGVQMGDAFLKAMPTIQKLLRKFDWPFIATVTGSGNVKVAWTRSDLIKAVGSESR